MIVFAPLTRVSATLQAIASARHFDPQMTTTAVATATAAAYARKDGEALVRATAAAVATATIWRDYAIVSFLPLRGSGSDYAYSQAVGALEPLTGYGEAGFFQPGYAIGEGILFPITTQGHGFTGGIGQGSGALLALGTLGSEGPYADARTSLQPLEGHAVDGLAHANWIISSARASRIARGRVSSLGTLESEADAYGLIAVRVSEVLIATSTGRAVGTRRAYARSVGVLRFEAELAPTDGEAWCFPASPSAVQGGEAEL
jgi:hypothetical protein